MAPSSSNNAFFFFFDCTTLKTGTRFGDVKCSALLTPIFDTLKCLLE